MSTVNKVILLGHLGDDINIHTFEGGGMIGRVPIATNENWKDKSTGEKKSRTDWHQLVFRNKGAELMEKYTQKGDKVYIEGQLQLRQWTTESGEKKYSSEVHVRDFKFMQTKGNDQTTAESLTNKQNESKAPADSFSPEPVKEAHDDLPF